MKKILMTTILLALVSASACSVLTPTPRPSPLLNTSPITHVPGDYSNLIVYISMRDGSPALYATRSDGTNTYRVVGGGQLDLNGGVFGWSPSAGRLAFAAASNGRMDIYTILPNGTGLFNVTGKLKQGGSEPTWSPDGKQLLFACGVYDPHICRINEDGSGLLEVTSNTGAQRAVNPSWSPDGARIVYQSNRGGLPGIHVINADGTNDKPLAGGVSQSAQSARPLWSPDNRQILFQSDQGGNWGIYLMDIDGSRLTHLAPGGKGSDVDAAWLPNGQKIAFRSNRDGDYSVWVVNRDGTGLANITKGKEPITTFSWSPDSKRLTFATQHDRNGEIYVVNLDGTGMTNISNHPGQDLSPLWLR